MAASFVNLSLTLSSAFPRLKDLLRNRLDGRLTRLHPTPTPDKYEENAERDVVAAALPKLFRLRAGVNFRAKIPALNRT
jgi:hypothetical protein